MPRRPLLLGLPSVPQISTRVEGGLAGWRQDRYYRIGAYDAMGPFFVSVMSDSDLWMYVSSTGGLTAGRRDALHALFPYETVDKLHVSHPHTGPKTVIRRQGESETFIWQPFAPDGRLRYQLERSIYKHVLGCELWFEEINLSLGLTFRYGWRPSDRFGWVRTVELINVSAGEQRVEILDGVQNLLPAGVDKGLQDTSSCLVDAYKYVECVPGTILALHGLTSNIVDRPEASEALRVTVAWQAGLDGAVPVLDAGLWERFMLGHEVAAQTELKGKSGSYLLKGEVRLAAGEARTWHIALDTPVDQVGVVSLRDSLKGDMTRNVETDIRLGRQNLSRLLAFADALQVTGDETATAHHISNVLFNIARGGVLPNQYAVDRKDLAHFLRRRNRPAASRHSAWVAQLPVSLSLSELRSRAEATGDSTLIRLCDEYLPIVFSRRHGDPSRPWNRFSIVMKNPDGSPLYAYQGNWRDIFQNWEALCRSFPECIESMVAKFVNASTIDGFNPYRVTDEGIEWEVADPDDPWSSIGYWGDHQIVYLLRLLEASRAHHPGRLEDLLTADRFSYADVPYDIKPYADMISDPHHTITFNWERQQETDRRVALEGSDGRLVHRGGDVVHVNLAEKLLVPILVKISNLVPEGGIWMNTMRPEWNDANNALAGNGLSVVTACYLYRHLGFCADLFEGAPVSFFNLSSHVADLLAAIGTIIDRYSESEIDDRVRRAFMDAAGQAFGDYRKRAYTEGPGEKTQVAAVQIVGMLRRARRLVANTIKANRRSDGLYHAYNILHLSNERAAISHLQVMLEGQVAALSAGVMTAQEAVDLLKALRASALYRDDQKTYLLYPVKDLPPYLKKNRVPESILGLCPRLAASIESGDDSVLVRDADGQLRFHPDFHNACALRARIAGTLPEEEIKAILDAYEGVFNHRAFTGRSGTMYGYEGIGCVYWHMVAKLLLAVQEVFIRAALQRTSEDLTSQLKQHYLDIRLGLGFMKRPDEFGAFPLDPYSHTPASGGAKQPGMTGQVKEAILARWGELGVLINEGKITFSPRLLGRNEFLIEEAEFSYIDINGRRQSLALEAGSLAFTFCQVPIIYSLGERRSIFIKSSDGAEARIDGDTIDESVTLEIFRRKGSVRQVKIQLPYA